MTRRDPWRQVSSHLARCPDHPLMNQRSFYAHVGGVKQPLTVVLQVRRDVALILKSLGSHWPICPLRDLRRHAVVP